jgi:hypothetical protein
VRASLVAAGIMCLVVLPTLGFLALGGITERPYGQDGGVVQLPLAMDKLLAGKSPYGADYSDSILGKESRVSDFWSARGGNPILHHHAYLPGTHLLMLPAYFAARALSWRFDPRVVTLLFYLLGAILAGRIPEEVSARLTAVAAFGLNPFVYWLQIFGANDILVATLLLLALLVGRRWPLWGAAILGLACATKQLAWPFAPFFLLHLAGGRWRKLLPPALAALAVFAVIVVPVAALDFHAFWGDIVVYNAGLPGGDNYPLGGTPGFGLANFLIYFGWVKSLKDYVPLAPTYLVLAPLGILLLLRQAKERTESALLLAGSAALLASLYLSRVVHPNYLILAAILIPIAGCLDRKLPGDIVVVPLLLLGWAVEIVEHEVFRPTWEDALDVKLPLHWSGLSALFGPRAGAALTQDPLGLVLSALAAGLGVLYFVTGALALPRRLRGWLLGASILVVLVLPTVVVTGVARASGQPRGETGFLASVGEGAAWAPRPVAEAWSMSFRHDPPKNVEGQRNPLAAGLPLLSRLGFDPRLLGLGLAGVLFILTLASSPDQERLLIIGVTLLSAPAAVGLAFGSGDVFILAGALGALTLARGGEEALVNGLLGGLGAVLPRTLLLSPFVLRKATAKGWGSLLLGYGLVSGLGYFLHPAPFEPVAFLRTPGVGLANLWPDQAPPLRTTILLLLVAGVLAWAWVSSRHESPLVGMGLALLLGLFVLPGTSAMDLAAPVVLLVLGARNPRFSEPA